MRQCWLFGAFGKKIEYGDSITASEDHEQLTQQHRPHRMLP